MNKMTAILLCLLTCAGCGSAVPPSDPSEITSRSDAWESALNAKDVDTLVSMYTDDARVMAPNLPLATGQQAVRDAFGGMIAAGITGTLTSVETRVAGDIGYNVGTFELTAGDGTTTTGKFIETWARGSDGVWRISNDIWNDDGPAAASMEEKSHLVIVHEVEDFDRWIAAWRGDDSRHDLFESNGAAHVHTLRSMDNPNQIALIVSVTDQDALLAMIASDEGQEAAAADGVVMDSITMLEEVR